MPEFKLFSCHVVLDLTRSFQAWCRGDKVMHFMCWHAATGTYTSVDHHRVRLGMEFITQITIAPAYHTQESANKHIQDSKEG